ncbi:uncharacterized protein METZ01_LOCUS122243 [marine metagenome]|uniref:Uncharacterized protein n=1 Tax=marine metagenome TaxID=408172 RepID=A0A381XX93_9ZZZZ
MVENLWHKGKNTLAVFDLIGNVSFTAIFTRRSPLS